MDVVAFVYDGVFAPVHQVQIVVCINITHIAGDLVIVHETIFGVFRVVLVSFQVVETSGAYNADFVFSFWVDMGVNQFEFYSCKSQNFSNKIPAWIFLLVRIGASSNYPEFSATLDLRYFDGWT